jgi:hypothetical protein
VWSFSPLLRPNKPSVDETPSGNDTPTNELCRVVNPCENSATPFIKDNEGDGDDGLPVDSGSQPLEVVDANTPKELSTEGTNFSRAIKLEDGASVFSGVVSVLSPPRRTYEENAVPACGPDEFFFFSFGGPPVLTCAVCCDMALLSGVEIFTYTTLSAFSAWVGYCNVWKRVDGVKVCETANECARGPDVV